jgi:spore germination protein YaaH
MVIHETDRGGLLTTLLDDQLAMTGLVRQIMAEVVYFRGVNLDLEGLGLGGSEEQLQSVQQKFNYFVSLLAAELHSTGKTLTLTLHPPNSYYRGYDYRRLGELADRIIIMAYDYGPKPEPVDKVQRAVEMAAAVVPRQKLLLGISMPSETPESILTKIAIAKRYNLAGIALWRLGLLTPEMWHGVRSIH